MNDPNHAMETNRNNLYPLSRFYDNAGRPLPRVTFLDPSLLPDPYKRLLHHSEDMTSVLQRHHGETISLSLLSYKEEDNKILREVILFDERKRPVEFGAIEIHLDRFPEEARSLIQASRMPLGAIIQRFKIDYVSAPEVFFRLTSDELIGQVFQLPEPMDLYGRVNRLSDSDDHTLAHVVEVLPPS